MSALAGRHPIRQFLAIVLLPPLAGCLIWMLLAWTGGVRAALLQNPARLQDVFAIVAAVQIVTVGVPGALVYHLLVVLPSTSIHGNVGQSVARMLCLRMLAVMSAPTALTAWILYEPRGNRLVDALWTAMLVAGIPVGTMTLMAAWLQRSMAFRKL